MHNMEFRFNIKKRTVVWNKVVKSNKRFEQSF